tara:strand:- start:443 stop:1411 length:969 start_codon:yes stop_codon:yes gene_type:complete
MKYSKIGKKQIAISKISLGLWKGFSHSSLMEKIYLYDYAFERGVNHYDSAPGYDDGLSEEFLSKFLINKKREDIIITTKIYFPSKKIPTKGLNKANLQINLEQTLKKLKTDYIDFLLCHRYDNETPIYETIDTINKLIFSGKVREWGISTYTPFQLCETFFSALHLSSQTPSIAHYPYNPFNRTIEMDLKEALQKIQIPIAAYYPLSQGILTGKYSKGISNKSRAAKKKLKNEMWDFSYEKLKKVEKLIKLGSSLNVSAANLSLLWCLHNKSVATLLTSVNNKKQLDENLKIFKFAYNNELHSKINNIFKNPPLNIYTGIKY